jgi:hypothetical protein
MEVTQVHYQMLMSLPNYENEKMGAWANVGVGETPEEAMADLKAWVIEQLTQFKAAKTSLEEINNQIYTRNHVLREVDEKARQAQARWEKAKAFLEAIGLRIPAGFEDDIPF